MSSLIFHYWKNREEYINTSYTGTEWMVCVISHIHEDVHVNENGDSMNQVDVVIKTMVHGISDD